MKTNDLKNGDRIQLRNGWYATIMDNKKGNVRMADVEGISREIGSVYAHDIITYLNPGVAPINIEHTPAQNQVRRVNADLFGG